MGEAMVRKTLVRSGAVLLLLAVSACTVGSLPPELLAVREEAEVLSRAGKTDRARALLEKAAEISEGELGPDHPEHARSLTRLGWFHQKRRDYAAAEPLYEQALVIREVALGPDHIDVARSLNTLGQLHFHQGRYFEATLVLNRAYYIVQSIRGLVPEHRELAERSLGKAYLWDYHPSWAVEHLEEALALEEAMPVPDDLRIAGTLHDLGTAYSFLRETGKAGPLHRRSLQIRESALGPEHPDVAESLTGLAINHYTMGDDEEAEKLLRRALAIRESTLGAGHADVGRTRSHLAEVFRLRGDTTRATELSAEALRITEIALGPSHGETISALLQHAEILAEQHRFVEARSAFRRVLDHQPKQSPRAVGAQARMLWELGSTADYKGAKVVATSFYEMALEVRQKNLLDLDVEPASAATGSGDCLARTPESSRDAAEIERALALRDEDIALKDSAVARSLNALAVLYRDGCDLAKAEDVAKRALAISAKVFGGLRRETGTAMRTLASVHAAKGELEKAEPLYRGALVILARTKERPHGDLGRRLSALGQAAAAKGQTALADSYHLMALHARELRQGRNRSDLVPTMLKLADNYLRRGELEKAEPLYRHSIAVWEGTVGADTVTFSWTLDTYAGLLRRLGREDEAKPYAERAAEIRAARRGES